MKKKIVLLLLLITSISFPLAVFAAVLDNADTAANWVSSDTTNTVVSQETTIKHEGTGSVKVQTVAETATSTVDLMEYSSDATAQAAYVSNSLCSTGSGGTETTSGAYRIHTFTGTGTFTISGTSTVDYLVVGGGGNGRAGTQYGVKYYGGGGGGGKVMYLTGQAITPGSYSAEVGGANTQSSFNGTVSGPGSVPADGYGTGGNSGNGFTGGIAEDNTAGAGGAGSTQNGNNAVTDGCGNGGNGTTNSITGSAAQYSGGGGGSRYEANAPPNHACLGVYGGGNGGTFYTGYGYPGTANTGGGGGGAYWGGTAGAGGSGIVIVRYLDLTLQSFSEASIKTQGSYSLKGIAKATTSLNKTLTKTLSPTLDLSNKTGITFDMRASRTGSNIKIGLHDSGGTTTEVTPNIAQADTFQSVSIDLSAVSNANKDVIDQIIITVVNADADNTFYVDNVVDTGKSLNDTVTLTTAATDLSGSSSISFWVYSSVTGSFARFQFGETASSEQTYPITIVSANTWEQKSFNISNIPAGDRNAVTKFAFQFTSDTSGASFYFDDINSNTYIGCPSVPNGGNYTVYDAGCAFNGNINGVDAGTGTDNTAILQIGQTVGEGGAAGDLTILSTQTIAVGEVRLINGSVTIIDGGQIKMDTPLYLPDADTDSYPTAVTTTQYISAATGRARRNIASDCNDTGTNAANVHISTTCYTDTDNDNYGTGAVKTCTNNATCGSATWASSTDGTAAAASDLADNATDCNDGNASLYQNITGYADADGDALTIANSSQVCSGASLPAGYLASVSSPTDTNDSQACATTDTNISGVTNSALVGTTCKKCSSGALANQTNAEDLWTQCTDPGVLILMNSAVALQTCNTMCAAQSHSLDNCSGSGACSTAAYACISTGNDVAGTNSQYWTYDPYHNPVCFSKLTCYCTSTAAGNGGLCKGSAAMWFYCRCD